MSGIDHLLDTNVVIGLLKGAESAVALAQQAGMALDRAAVSQITRMELPGFAGLNDAEEQAARAFLSAFQVVGITAEIEDKAIRLRRSGALKLPDAIVAATALSTGAALLTLDQRLSRVVEAQRRLHAR
jgi:predicted nucleic acid-binding protein